MTDLGGAADNDLVRLTCWLSGRVQGVGMRWWVRSRALEHGLSGWAANLGDGRVEVVVEGPRQSCDALLVVLRGVGRPGHVTTVTVQWSAAAGVPAGFRER